MFYISFYKSHPFTFSSEHIVKLEIFKLTQFQVFAKFFDSEMYNRQIIRIAYGRTCQKAERPTLESVFKNNKP